MDTILTCALYMTHLMAESRPPWKPLMEIKMCWILTQHGCTYVNLRQSDMLYGLRPQMCTLLTTTLSLSWHKLFSQVTITLASLHLKIAVFYHIKTTDFQCTFVAFQASPVQTKICNALNTCHVYNKIGLILHSILSCRHLEVAALFLRHPIRGRP